MQKDCDACLTTIFMAETLKKQSKVIKTLTELIRLERELHHRKQTVGDITSKFKQN